MTACATNQSAEPVAETDSDGDGVPEYLDRCVDTPPEAPTTQSGCPSDSDGDGAPDYLDLCQDTPPGAAACTFGCPPGEPIVINLINDEFEFDRATLKPAMQAHLDTLIEHFHSLPDITHLSLIGHTDFIGTQAYNLSLSLRRAEAVKRYLMSNGLDRMVMYTVGRGEMQPLAPNDTPANRARNRRVEIVPLIKAGACRLAEQTAVSLSTPRSGATR